MKTQLCKTALAAALASAFAALAQTAQTATVLDPVVVSAQRSNQSTFDAPASISAVTREVIDSAGPQVNLSEVLNRVPGITVLNRQNYAQDLQLSIRGFGSRSTFGIRGVRLIVDGIPATMPDGQGQASSIALSSAQRIEVLRGPLAQLYGNAAGGVVQIFTGSDATVPTTSTSAATGPDSLVKLGWKFASAGPADTVLLDASQFRTGGYREHSKAERGQLNGKWEHEIDRDTKIRLVFNALDQPVSLDPLGLTRAQWDADPKQAGTLAEAQNTRKSVSQQQMGAVFERAFGDATLLSARVYFGDRALDNALSVPLSAQQAATSSGGIVSFTRGYSGLATTLSHTIKFGGEQALRLVGGLEYDQMAEDRKGYINNAGVQGALKRDERNSVANRDLFVQAVYDFDARFSATAGLRSSDVRFRSVDHFIAPGNPDDSGSVSYSATNPVLGLSWHVAPTLNLYANAGQGFETPTFTELAYRPAGTGLNIDLHAARSRHAELGAKWKVATGHRIDAAFFDISTREEITVDTNSGGRSTFKNAGRTSRRGAEFQYLGQLASDWHATLALTLLRARFLDTTVTGSGPAAVTIPAGNRLPGTPDRSGFAELAYAPVGAWGGFNAAAEVAHTGRLYVNDANDDSAPVGTVINLRAGLAQTVGEWRFTQLLRVDNAANRRYAGSVIVNEANRRFFEPAQPRTWLLALTAKYEFR